MKRYRYESTVTGGLTLDVPEELGVPELHWASVVTAVGEPGRVEWASSSTLTETVDVPDPSIDQTGATDVTVPLQAFLNEITGHGTVEWPDTAVYRCEDQLRFPKYAHHRFGGCTFLRETVPDKRNVPQLVWHDPQNVITEDAKTRGAYETGRFGKHEGHAGIRIEGGSGFVAIRPDIADSIGDSVCLAAIDHRKRPSGLYMVPENVAIIDPVLGAAGRDNIAVTAGQQIQVQGGHAEGGRNTIIVEPNTDAAFVYGFTIDGMEFGPSRGATFRAHASSRMRDFAVTNCKGRGQHLEFWVVNNYGTPERPTGFWFTDNESDTLTDGGEPTIRLIGVDDAHVLRNKQRLRAGVQVKAGVLIRDVNGHEIVTNDFGPGIAQFVER